MKYKKFFKILFLSFLVFSIFVFPIASTHAQESGVIQSIIGCGSISGCFLKILLIPLEVVGTLVSFFLDLLTKFINIPSGQLLIPAVHKTWEISLSFANLAFILLLIITAFGTIFDIKSYTYTDILPSLIVVALLINFSFAIGEGVFQFSNQLSSFVLQGVGNDLAATILEGSPVLTKIVTDKGTGLKDIPTESEAIQQSIIKILFFIVFGVITLFTILAALLFLMVRLPIIWLLLAIAPFAWITYALPAFRSSGWKTWWSSLIGWSFFTPVYLFFLWVAVVFLKSTTKLQFNSGTSGLSWLASVIGGNEIFTSVVVIILLLGGLSAARKVGSLAGGGFEQVFGRIERGIKATPRVLATKTPIIGPRVEAGVAAVKATQERIKKEGLKPVLGKFGGVIYEGKAAKERREIKYGGKLQDFLGFKPRFETEKAFVKDGNESLETLEDQFNNRQIEKADIISRALSAKPGDPSGFAAAKLAVKKGWLSNTQYTQMLQKVGQNRFAVDDIISAAKENDFVNMDTKDILNFAEGKKVGYTEFGENNNFTNARQETFKHIASKIEDNPLLARDIDIDHYTEGLKLLGDSSVEGKKFKRAIGKVRPDLVATYNIAHPPVPVPGAPPVPAPTYLSEFDKILETKSAADISKFTIHLWDLGSATRAPFLVALYHSIERSLNTMPPIGTPNGNRQRTNYFENYIKQILNSSDTISNRETKADAVRTLVTSLQSAGQLPP